MLVLTRKTQQQIQIGPHITITILEVKGHSVRVGIQAPRDVNVVRSELAARIAQEEKISKSAPSMQQSTEPSATQVELTVTQTDESRPTVNPSVRCRAPRARVAPKMTHPVRTGPASLGNFRSAPLNSRIQGLLTR